MYQTQPIMMGRDREEGIRHTFRKRYCLTLTAYKLAVASSRKSFQDRWLTNKYRKMYKEMDPAFT